MSTASVQEGTTLPKLPVGTASAAASSLPVSSRPDMAAVASTLPPPPPGGDPAQAALILLLAGANYFASKHMVRLD